MKRNCSTLMVAFFIVFSEGFALAQPAAGLDTERFKPAMDDQGVILTEGGQGAEPGSLNLGFYLHYSRNPLVIMQNDRILKSLVSDRLAANFLISLGLTNWLTVGVDVPAVFAQQGASFVGSGQYGSLASAALGEIRVAPKFTLLREDSHGLSLALNIPVSLPSGDETAFLGNENVTVSPTVALSRHFFKDILLVAFNLGFWIREKAELQDLQTQQEFFFRLGAGVKFADRWWAMGEAAGATRLDNPFQRGPESPLEWLLGLRFHGPKDLFFTAGGAVGSIDGWGTPNFRAFLGLLWAPRVHDRDEDGVDDKDDKCPDEPGAVENGGCPWGDEDRDGVNDRDDKCPQESGPADNQGCPWGDTDGDGLKDNQDRCPKEPGPVENNGCPWGDQDGDGLNDQEDRCPNEAGPADNQGCPWGDADGDGLKDDVDKCPREAGPAENSGCPLKDSDGDSFLDNVDKCPNEPEDKDEFEDEDGCPDPDNDKDGIPDKADKCPNEPETINGFQDDDGCPDKGKVLVIIKQEKIEILQKVHFATSKATIMADSFSLLDQVAQVIKGHAEIKQIRVEGHTDSQGPDAFNMKLSQDRADAVRTYLLNKGVDAGRLEAVGYGETKPISSNNTAKGREQNRRVEFMILEPGGSENVPSP